MNLIASLRRLLFCLVGLTLPFEHYAIGEFGGFWLTPNKLLAALLLGFAILDFGTGGQRGTKPPRDAKRPWVILLVVALGISGFQAVALGTPVGGVVTELMTWYALALFYFTLVYLLRTRRDLDLLLGSFLLGCLIAAVSGWLGYGEELFGARYGGERLAGEGGNPNLLAFNLLIAIAVALSFYFTTRSMAWRLFNLGAVGVMLVAITATASRSGLLAAVVLGVFWTYRYRARMLRYAIPVALLVATTVVLIPESSIQRYQTISVEGVQTEYSARGRLEMWYGTFRAFLYNPLTGVGVGRWKAWAGEIEGVRAVGIHNAFLRVLADAGLLGFVPFTLIVAFTWTAFARARRLARRAPRGNPNLPILELRVSMLQIGLAAVLVMSMFQPTNQHKGLWLMAALSTIVLGMVRACAGERAPAGESFEGAPWASAVPGASLPRPAGARGS